MATADSGQCLAGDIQDVLRSVRLELAEVSEDIKNCKSAPCSMKKSDTNWKRVGKSECKKTKDEEFLSNGETKEESVLSVRSGSIVDKENSPAISMVSGSMDCKLSLKFESSEKSCSSGQNSYGKNNESLLRSGSFTPQQSQSSSDGSQIKEMGNMIQTRIKRIISDGTTSPVSSLLSRSPFQRLRKRSIQKQRKLEEERRRVQDKRSLTKHNLKYMRDLWKSVKSNEKNGDPDSVQEQRKFLTMMRNGDIDKYTRSKIFKGFGKRSPSMEALENEEIDGNGADKINTSMLSMPEIKEDHQETVSSEKPTEDELSPKKISKEASSTSLNKQTPELSPQTSAKSSPRPQKSEVKKMHFNLPAINTPGELKFNFCALARTPALRDSTNVSEIGSQITTITETTSFLEDTQKQPKINIIPTDDPKNQPKWWSPTPQNQLTNQTQTQPALKTPQETKTPTNQNITTTQPHPSSSSTTKDTKKLKSILKRTSNLTTPKKKPDVTATVSTKRKCPQSERKNRRKSDCNKQNFFPEPSIAINSRKNEVSYSEFFDVCDQRIKKVADLAELRKKSVDGAGDVTLKRKRPESERKASVSDTPQERIPIRPLKFRFVGQERRPVQKEKITPKKAEVSPRQDSNLQESTTAQGVNQISVVETASPKSVVKEDNKKSSTQKQSGGFKGFFRRILRVRRKDEDGERKPLTKAKPGLFSSLKNTVTGLWAKK